jgi:hypothetical protein
MKKSRSDPESLPCQKFDAAEDIESQAGQIDLILELTVGPAYE